MMQLLRFKKKKLDSRLNRNRKRMMKNMMKRMMNRRIKIYKAMPLECYCKFIHRLIVNN
jgi:hypothetical protein